MTTYSDVIAIAQDGSESWSRRVAIDGVEILEMDNGLILGAAKSRVLWPLVKPGQAAPELDAAAWITAEGEHDPPDLTNKRMLIVSWSQDCGPCVGELPKLVKLAKQYEQSDLVIIGWHESRADPESLTEFARAHGLPYALAIDREAEEPGWFGALFKSFGVRGIPQAALIDRDGRIVFVGYLDQVIAKLDGG